MLLHQPILLNEVLNEFDFSKNQIFIDGTFGRGGHTQAILKNLNSKSQLIAFDKDPEAIDYAKKYIKDKRFNIYLTDYKNINPILNKLQLNKINNALLDIGMCSTHIDQSKRGFSYRFNSRLDMRYDLNQDLDAHKYLNTVSMEQLIKILFEYSQERMSKKIANKIIQMRDQNEMNTTFDLKQAIIKAIGSEFNARNLYNKIFQAIRIVVNNELDSFKEALESYFHSLVKFGKLLIITFHSLEDKILKNFVYDKNENYLSKYIPIQPIEKIKIIKKIKPSNNEIEQNSKSKFAKLYVLMKLI